MLLISIDSLRADHVGAYGYAPPTTPTIDRLAKDGVLFRRAVSTTSWTLPAHAALLTGMHDAEHGATLPTSTLDSAIPTLAEAMTAAGYRTVGLYSGPFLSPAFGFERGFEEYVSCTSYDADDGERRTIGALHAASHKDVTNPLIANAFARAVADRDARPSFFFVHMWDVHYDLYPPPPYDRMFDPDYSGSYSGHAYRHDRAFKPGMDEHDYAHVIALYDGEVRSTDDTIARMLDELERAALLDHTIVVVTSDHGDEFLEHGKKGHRQSLYHEVLSIPLIFWAPKLLKSGVAEVDASLIDVAPSLLALTRLAPMPSASGKSLFDADGSVVRDGRVALSELRFSARRPALTAATAYPHKVIVDARKKTSSYFDLATDPGEASPRDPHELPEGRRLIDALDRFYASAEPSSPRSATTRKKLPGVIEERLRSLGYLD